MDAGAVGQIPWDAFNSNLRESTGWVCRDVETHLMRATLRQVLNVPTYPPSTGCSIGVEVCRQTTVAADKGT